MGLYAEPASDNGCQVKDICPISINYRLSIGVSAYIVPLIFNP